jgi:hypothetical protein
MKLAVLWLQFVLSRATTIAYPDEIRKSFCVDRTGFSESECRDVHEGVLRCHLPIESFLRYDVSLDCSDSAIGAIARSYEIQSEFINDILDDADSGNPYPASYVDFLSSTADYSEINKELFYLHPKRKSSVLLLAIAQISLLTSRPFGSSNSFALPMDDIFGFVIMWNRIHPPKSRRFPLMRGQTRFRDSESVFNLTILLLSNRTTIYTGLEILDHLLVNIPQTLDRLIAVGQMQHMGRLDYTEKKRYLNILSDLLDSFQIMTDVGGPNAIPFSMVAFVVHAVFTREISQVRRFHEPRAFLDITRRNIQIGSGFNNLRTWGFLTNDVTRYLQSYIQHAASSRDVSRYDLESLQQVDLNVLSVDEYFFFLDNLRGDGFNIVDGFERDIIVKYVNFLARSVGLDIPSEDSLDYVTDRRIMDLIPTYSHHALMVMYRATYCLDHPYMLFVILKLIRMNSLEFSEYFIRTRDYQHAYMNYECFESSAVDGELPHEWAPDQELVLNSIRLFCRSLYRCLGTRRQETEQVADITRAGSNTTQV